MEIIDYESRLLAQKVLNEFQINQIRNNFIEVLGINKTHFDFNDFVNLIHSLLESNQVSQQDIQIYFLTFDQNKDGKLDWNEYLVQFVNYINQVQCLKYLKSLSSLTEQSLYLKQLQIAFLASPFKSQFQTKNLQQVYQTLVALEGTTSNKHIKKYYFLCRDTIDTVDTLINQDIIIFQDFNNLASQIITILKSILSQRLPHIRIYIQNYVTQLINEIIARDYCDHLYKLLLLEDEKDHLFGLQAITLIIASISIFQIQINFPIQSELLIETVLNTVFESQNGLIIKQSYLLLGHLSLLNQNFRKLLFSKRQSIIDIELKDDEELFYHSWFIGCLFQRYENDQGHKFINQMNQLPDNLLWLQSLFKYYQQYGLINSIENNQLRIQIQINMLIIISPILSTQLHQDILITLLQILQNPQADNRYKIQIIVTIKQIFKLPNQLRFQNFTAQNILLSNNLLNILILLMSDSNIQISYKAKKLFFKTLCQQNYGILLKYLQESNNITQFLFVLEQYLVVNDEQSYFKYQVLNILKQLSQDSNIFQILSKDQWLFRIFIKVLIDNNQIFQQKNQIMLNCQGDYLILKEILEYCTSFTMHFQIIIRSKQQLTYQAIQIIHNMLPDQPFITEIKQYFVKFLENINKQQPLMLKKYLKPIYQAVCDIVIQILSLSVQLNDLLKNNNQVYHANILQSLTYLIQDLTVFQEYLNQQKEIIDDTLLIVGTEATFDGCVVATVYLNNYKSADKCKIVLKSQLTMLDFEQQVEYRLKITSPLLYLVINQNHPNKIPYDNFSIIDESCFLKFKELADQLIETQFGSVKVPQEVIAVELFRLKMENYSMKKIYEILTKGSTYIQFKQIQDNKMLWFLENQTDAKDKGQLLQQIYQLTNLPFNYIEDLFNSINQFFEKNNMNLQYRSIVQQDFEDYLREMKIPLILAKKITYFLAKNGLNNPVDFQDFICFVSLFYQQKYFSETIIMKFTYLLYANERGIFGEEQLYQYLETIFMILEQSIDVPQLKAWAQGLFQKIDQNQDQHISFYEYHALLKDSQYRTKLLDPICKVFTHLPHENTNNRFFLNQTSPMRLFRN